MPCFDCIIGVITVVNLINKCFKNGVIEIKNPDSNDKIGIRIYLKCKIYCQIISTL